MRIAALIPLFVIVGCSQNPPEFAIDDSTPVPRRTPVTSPARAPASVSPAPAPTIDDAYRTLRLENDIPAARRIVESGLDINARDHAGRTLLSHAASHGDGPFCQWLIDRGADANSRDNDGRSVLSYAADNIRYSKNGAVSVLVNAGANVNNETAVFVSAIQAGDVDGVKAFIAKGADVNARVNGQPIITRFWRNSAQAVLLLIQAGADVNAASGGFTSLHRAAEIDAPEVAQVLIAHGAKLDATVTYFDEKLTPLSIARQNHSQHVLKILLAQQK